MAYIPYAPELAAKYTLTGPDGAVASFNDKTDANYAGAITDLSGLDSADVTDSGGTLVQADGGYQGTNWYGRRPIVMSVQTYGYSDVLTRNTQLAKIREACDAMSADATLSWLNTAVGSVAMHVPVRRQQPLRITGGFNKTVSIPLVSYIAPILGPTMTAGTGTTSVTAENQGDYKIGGINYIQISGPTAGALTITNTTTGGVIKFLVGMTVPAGGQLYVYPQLHVAFLSTLGYVNNYIDYVNSTWVTMPKGNNTITTNTGTISINYSSAWI